MDRGYDACMWFWEHRILGKYINIDKVAFKEVNFKSKLLEWSQKNRVRMEFKDIRVARDLFDGNINAVASIGQGDVRIRGMISQVDNVNRILDRVALYLT